MSLSHRRDGRQLTDIDPKSTCPVLRLPKRRQQLSELDSNSLASRRTVSLQPVGTDDVAQSQDTSRKSERHSSLLLYQVDRKGRHRLVSRQSENERPVSRLEHSTILEEQVEQRLKTVLRETGAEQVQRRCPSFAVDGPADRRESHDHRRSDLSVAAAGIDRERQGSLPDGIIEGNQAFEPTQKTSTDVIGAGMSFTLGNTDIELRTAEGQSRTTNILNTSYCQQESASVRHTISSVPPSPSKRPSLPGTPSLDRYIHARRPGLQARDTFIASRDVSALTPRERATRRRTGFTDPLGPSEAGPSNPTELRGDQVQRSIGSNRTASLLALRPETEARSTNAIRDRNAPGNGIARAIAQVGQTGVSRRSNLGFGLAATHHAPKFLEKRLPIEDRNLYEKRLALALDLDLTRKVLGTSPISSGSRIQAPRSSTWCLQREERIINGVEGSSRTFWEDNQWKRRGLIALLEAEGLRDDYYCSVLAYSYRADRLAVGLGSKVYLWSEDQGLIHPPSQLEVQPPIHRPAYITSLAFSSESGGKAILAVGRVNGRLMLWSPLDTESRFMTLTMPHSAAHLSFRPQTIKRQSQRHESMMAENEVLLVGDDYGNVWVFLIEWPKEQDRFLYGWDGGLALIANVSVHVQQICGIAWSADGDYFATGGNDNLCCLFQANSLFGKVSREMASTMAIRRDASGHQYVSLGPTGSPNVVLGPETMRHFWRLTAAVKAIAFCPWQRGLLAAGGGSNDRCIHFYHTMSGACLATIDCAAQVTSLVWSSTRREIAATLGFPQPEHAYRIVVYAWPSCEQVVAIQWHDEMRALYAIAYPGGPNEKTRPSHEDASWWSRSGREECMVVAGSDGSVKFHEIWSQDSKNAGPGKGLLGGSDILESLHGIDKEFGETIR